MTFLTHTITGITIGTVLTQTTGIDYHVTIPTSIFFSILPDFNLAWRKISEHHKDITHYPIFYILLTGIIFLVEYLLSIETYIFSLSLVISAFFHLLLDTFGVRLGVHWLAPFNYHEFSFTNLDKSTLKLSITEKLQSYYKSKNLFIEIVVILINVGIIVLYH